MLEPLSRYMRVCVCVCVCGVVLLQAGIDEVERYEGLDHTPRLAPEGLEICRGGRACHSWQQGPTTHILREGCVSHR
jgi:hypothetical protein